ncbi:class I SAM-dependent methyltransferase [Candidatus Pelagibacter sp.]|nr:class I SAM-dependent methyltransferase [Candidatus Pelagibacter sp.]
MIERTSKEFVLKLLDNNQKNWNILDIGCNLDAVKYAQTVADETNFSSFYKDKKFVVINNKRLPFKDKEFDFVYASHVIEHVEDVSTFISELQRISNQGYIELPSMLEDNLILSDNSIKDHKWFFQFNDVNKVLLAERKKQLIEPFLTHGLLFSVFRKNFRSSLVLELLWKKEINFKFENFTVPAKKSNFYTIIKKYISYRIRTNKITFGIILIILVFFIFNAFIF